MSKANHVTNLTKLPGLEDVTGLAGAAGVDAYDDGQTAAFSIAARGAMFSAGGSAADEWSAATTTSPQSDALPVAGLTFTQNSVNLPGDEWTHTPGLTGIASNLLLALPTPGAAAGLSLLRTADFDASVDHPGAGTLRIPGTNDAPPVGDPIFSAAVINPFGLTNTPYNASPGLADIDGDGDLDAFVGKGDGTTQFFRNTGSASAPAFTAQSNFGLADVGFYANPDVSPATHWMSSRRRFACLLSSQAQQ